MKINKLALISLVFLVGSTGLTQGADVSTFVMGAKKMTLSPDSNTMNAGYYTTAALSVIDADLTADNIKRGVVIFGITGTLSPLAWLVGIGLPDTGQTTCYDAAGIAISCPAPGAALAQDGSYRPVVIQQSYTDNDNGTTMDNITGLIWVRNPDAAGTGGGYTWISAINTCESLNYAGYSDWRLPNVRDLASIVNRQNEYPAINTTFFLNTLSGPYWSSTTDVSNTARALFVHFMRGEVNINSKNAYNNIRCVRGGP